MPDVLKHDLFSSSIFLCSLYTGRIVLVDKIIDDEYTGINNCICVNIKNHKNNLEDERIFIEGIIIHGNLLSKILNCNSIIKPQDRN